MRRPSAKKLGIRASGVSIVEMMVSLMALGLVMAAAITGATALQGVMATAENYSVGQLATVDYLTLDLRRASTDFNPTVAGVATALNSKLTLPITLGLPQYYRGRWKDACAGQKTLVTTTNKRSDKKKHRVVSARYYYHYGTLGSTVSVQYYLSNGTLFRKRRLRDLGFRLGSLRGRLARAFRASPSVPRMSPATPRRMQKFAAIAANPVVTTTVSFLPTRRAKTSPPPLSNSTFMRQYYYSDLLASKKFHERIHPATETKPTRGFREHGSAIIVVILSIAVLTIIAGTLMSYTTSKQAAPFQAASWQEAGTAAEGGVELALSALRRSIDEGPTAWGGWAAATRRQGAHHSAFFKKYLTDGNLLSHTGEGNNEVRAIVEVFTPDGPNTVNPHGNVGCAKGLRDPLHGHRQSVRSEPGRPLQAGPGAAQTEFPERFPHEEEAVANGKPQVARMIEAIAAPVTPFPLAIIAKEQIDLKSGAVAVPSPTPAILANLNSDTMRVDSYDPSRKPSHTWGNSKTDYLPDAVLQNGSIATNGKKNDIIRLEKVAILGNIAKGGGTVNIKSPGAIVTGEIIDGFYRELKPVPYPGTTNSCIRSYAGRAVWQCC